MHAARLKSLLSRQCGSAGVVFSVFVYRSSAQHAFTYHGDSCGLTPAYVMSVCMSFTAFLSVPASVPAAVPVPLCFCSYLKILSWRKRWGMACACGCYLVRGCEAGGAHSHFNLPY